MLVGAQICNAMHICELLIEIIIKSFEKSFMAQNPKFYSNINSTVSSIVHMDLESA
jgi:hypothetical protein